MTQPDDLYDFLSRHARPYDPASDTYRRPPFAAPVKATKATPIYNAHSYHTKVPPEGIVPYILHYTDPGDLILDPFCGSGMTGVAALMCAHPPAEALRLVPGARPGPRYAVLNDLSPAAVHIAYNYCTPVDVEALKAEFARIQEAVKEEFDWLYGTTCDRCGGPATIQYTIWSDVLECARCRAELVLWDVAVDHGSGKVRERFTCPTCGKEQTKREARWLRSIPVVTNYECRGHCRPKRAEHSTTEAEKRRIAEIEAAPIPYWYPTTPFDESYEMWRGVHRDQGITDVSKFYTVRNLRGMAKLFDEIQRVPDKRVRHALMFSFTAIAQRCSKLNRLRPSLAGDPLTGTLYIGSLIREENVFQLWTSKIQATNEVFRYTQNSPVIVNTGSATGLPIAEPTVDYIFTDPPFGCLTPEALVLTERGYRPIAQVQVGERVLSHAGRWNEVQATSERPYRGPLIELEVAFFNHSLRLTPNHLVLAIRTHPCDYDLAFCRPECSHLRQCNYHCGRYYREYRPEWIPAGELHPYDLVLMPTLRESDRSRSLRLSNYLPSDSYTLDGDALCEALPHEMGLFLPVRAVRRTDYEGPVYDLQTADHSFTTAWGCVHNSNIFYADCNLIWEAWLGQFTDQSQEAVVHVKHKDKNTLPDYARLMTEAFREMYRVLKPGRWASVVFHNSDDRIWQVILDAAEAAGFELVEINSFDKGQLSFKGIRGAKGIERVTNKDIVLNLRKPRPGEVPAPNGRSYADQQEVRIVEAIAAFLEKNPPPQERTLQGLWNHALYGMLRDGTVTLSMAEVETLLPYYFKQVDGRWYLRGEAVMEGGLGMIIKDEASAIAWLSGILRNEPQTTGDLIPKWQAVTREVTLTKTLDQILEENFWRDERTGRWRLPTEEERRRKSAREEVTAQAQLRVIRRFLEGNLDRRPGDAELCAWIRFCYQREQYAEAVALFPNVDESRVDPEEYRQIRKIVEVCRLRAG